MENYPATLFLPHPSFSSTMFSPVQQSDYSGHQLHGDRASAPMGGLECGRVGTGCSDGADHGALVGGWVEGEGRPGGKGKAAEGKRSRGPRFAFQTRSHVDVLDDGYRWRKYGQKAVKNDKFPRSYYKCKYQGCSVKKQVQRHTKDEEVVVMTYDGVHTHPVVVERTTDDFEHLLRHQMQIYATI